MDRDLMVMIYGSMMGVVGSIVASIVTAVFSSGWNAANSKEDNRRKGTPS